ncbi:MAG: DUF1905 domain-containing protein [Flavitalea sp.]
MSDTEKHKFSAKLYKIGINLVVDVPLKITSRLVATRGLIRIRGFINEHPFHTTLMPVKEKPYILYVNIPMLKGAGVQESGRATFLIEQDNANYEVHYPMLPALDKQLKEHKLTKNFNLLSESRKKDILKYLNNVKSVKTLNKHIGTVIQKLLDGEVNVRIP